MTGILSGQGRQEAAELDAGEERPLDFAQREVVLRANLDEADADRCVWTSMRFLMGGPRHPRVGELVFVIDTNSGGMMGRVEELNGWMARVRLLQDQAPGFA
jgi:kynureninase